jgi:serine/threonine protein kinase
MTDNPASRASGRGLHFGALPAGYPLGQYRLQSVIGVGGFGITYRATDERLRRPVAIKEYLPTDFAIRVGGIEVRPRSPSDQEMFTWGLTRFLDEARVLAALNDAPNIVHVYDYLEANGTGYMVMELIEGEPLDKVLARVGKVPAQSILALLPSLLKGMEAVHRAGYLHRDIKPANILVRTTGEPVLVDFGAARMSMGQRTQVMTSIYSPGYAPPEQYAFGTDANKQGPWSDIYAMAATLYHAITGVPPADAVRRLAKDTYTPLTQSAAGQYQPGFLSAVDAALSLAIDRRPQSVAAWTQMLFGDSRMGGLPASGPPSVPGAFAAGAGAMYAAPAYGAPPSQPGAYPAVGYPPAGPPSAPGWPPGTTGGPPPGPAFDAAAGGNSARLRPDAIPSQQAFAPGVPPPAPYYQPTPSVGAPPRRGGAGIWIAVGVLALLLVAGGAGAFYYFCIFKTYCDNSEEDDASACYEELARVRVEIQRIRARLPNAPAATPAPRSLTCREELDAAKAELGRLQELARNPPPTPPVEPKPPIVEPKPPVVEPKPPTPPVDTKPMVEPKPPVVEPKPPVVEPKPPTPPVDTKPTVEPKPTVVEPKPPTPPPSPPKPPVEPKPPPSPVIPKPPAPPPTPPTEPPSQYEVHEGRWFGSANLVREADRGRCAPAFTLNGVVKDNIFHGSSSLGGSASIRIRSRTKRVADLSLPGLTVRSTSGTFESFNLETTTGCIYTVRMFRQ